eukprot:TRINITY_DN1468_c0_g1_i1.p2 TRINITY_DN1468_c0_g1~~TRINITY_DN1468_c0_g1_i1.p2  ORF type:complete len:185 (-),score=34.67 TRINITY_DN1468_c0_g1_i1:97-651(-)
MSLSLTRVAPSFLYFFFFFNDTATTEIYTLHIVGSVRCVQETGTYKRQISSLTSYGLSDVLKMRPVSYFLKNDITNRFQIGFIAQEMKKIIPEVVEGEDGKMGLAYPKLIPVLVNAIKEQQDIIKSQEAKIKSLEDRLSALEAKFGKQSYIFTVYLFEKNTFYEGNKKCNGCLLYTSPSPRDQA